MKTSRSVSFCIAAVAGLLILSVVFFLPASGQSATTSTVSTGTNIPSPTGCTAPGYLAPAGLLTELGSNKTVDKGFSLGTPPKSDRPYEYLFLGGGALLALLILIGIIWAIAVGVRRMARRSRQEGQALAKKSHAFRNVYLAFLLIALIATGVAGYVLSPYLVPTQKTEEVPNGMVQNIASPYEAISLNPLSIKYYYVPAYVNNASTLYEGNFTVSSGGGVIAAVLPDSQRSAFFADLESGNFTGVSGCTMGGMPVYYDSGTVTSGAFAVEIPPVSNQTNYDLVFANPSGNQTVTLTANVFWAY